LYRAQIIYEQNASKNVKKISHNDKDDKIKVVSCFLGHGVVSQFHITSKLDSQI